MASFRPGRLGYTQCRDPEKLARGNIRGDERRASVRPPVAVAAVEAEAGAPSAFPVGAHSRVQSRESDAAM